MANPNPDTSNLVKWQPGQSGNPSGRPKKRKTVNKRLLRDALYEEVKPSDIRAIVRKAIGQAKLGNRYARRDLFEYILGKPVPMERTDNDAVMTLIQVLSGQMPQDDDIIDSEAVQLLDEDDSDAGADDEEEEDITPE